MTEGFKTLNMSLKKKTLEADRILILKQFLPWKLTFVYISPFSHCDYFKVKIQTLHVLKINVLPHCVVQMLSCYKICQVIQ